MSGFFSMYVLSLLFSRLKSASYTFIIEFISSSIATKLLEIDNAILLILSRDHSPYVSRIYALVSRLLFFPLLSLAIFFLMILSKSLASPLIS